MQRSLPVILVGRATNIREHSLLEAIGVLEIILANAGDENSWKGRSGLAVDLAFTTIALDNRLS